MGLEWADVLNVCVVFPNTQELRATSNRITNLDTPSKHNFGSLNLLDLEGNDIKEWSEICKLSVIPDLQHLNVENAGIASIRLICDTSTITLSMLSALKKLVISRNFIDEVIAMVRMHEPLL